MRVLVTGHNGYVGTVMVPMLVAAGHEVVGLDSNFYEDVTFGSADGVQSIPALRKDVRDVEASDLEGFDAIIHLAALSNDPLGDLNPELTYEINHVASVRLARLAKEVGVTRFIFSSSCSNYGAAGEDWLNEESGRFDIQRQPYIQREKSKIEQNAELQAKRELLFVNVLDGLLM